MHTEGTFTTQHWEARHLQRCRENLRREYSKQIIDFLIMTSKESKYYNPVLLNEDLHDVSLLSPDSDTKIRSLATASRSNTPINTYLSEDQERFLEDMAPTVKRSRTNGNFK